MPRGDGTGPRGIGSMSGHSGGFCTGYGVPGHANAAPDRGRGTGFGRGRGRRNCYYATGLPGWARLGGSGSAGLSGPAMGPDLEREKQALKAHADALESELGLVRKRLGDLEAGGEEG